MARNISLYISGHLIFFWNNIYKLLRTQYFTDEVNKAKVYIQVRQRFNFSGNKFQPAWIQHSTLKHTADKVEIEFIDVSIKQLCKFRRIKDVS